MGVEQLHFPLVAQCACCEPITHIRTPIPQVSTRILGRRTEYFSHFRIPDRVLCGFTQDPSTDRATTVILQVIPSDATW